MATIFQQFDDQTWRQVELQPRLPERHQDGPPVELRELGLEIIRCPGAGRSGLALLVEQGAEALVNGEVVPGQIRVLEHKDEIVAGGRRYFFSAEAVPEIVAYRATVGQRSGRCPVCRCPIEDGQPVVRCPGPNCGRVYHQIAGAHGQREKLCWSFDTECKFCRHPTSLSGRLAWTPDQEESDV